jgi:DNA-binding transcriptional MerR regulator
MLKIEGSDYKTIADVAKEEFGVSVKTLRQWIDKGIIPTPPKKE